jgi:hypothetical protein
MIDELGKVLEGSGSVVVAKLRHPLPGGIEEDHENLAFLL